MTKEAIVKDARIRMNKSIESASAELAKVRTGRASTSLLDQITVQYYGNPAPLSQVATVSVMDARTLSVSPWEKNMVPVVEKAILEANLGLNPATAGQVIRVPLPPLTEERRIEMNKLVHHEGENGKIAIRNIRRDANAHLKELMKSKALAEDDEKRALDEIQQLTDDSVAKLDDLLAEKEKQILEV